MTAPRRALGHRATSLVVAGLVALCVIAPWTLRNYVVADEPVLVSRQTGVQLAGIYNEQSADLPTPALWAPYNVIERDAELTTRHGFTELDLDEELTRRALDYARDHPGYVLEAVLWNSIRMLDLQPSLNDHFALTLNVTSGQAHLIRWGWYLVAILAGIGAATAVAARAPRALWLTPLALFAAGAVTAGFVRYRAPVDPFAVLLAACAVGALVERRGRLTAPG